MNRRSCDKVIVVSVIILIVIGLISVYSATSVLPSVKAKFSDKGGMIYLKKQIFTLFLGIILMLILMFLPEEKLKKITLPLLILSFILLILVFTPLGVSAGGAKRWIRIPPNVFQPSELAKLAMVFFLAWFLSKANYKKDSIRDFLIPISVMGVFQAIFIKQPDFGAFLTIGILTFTILFIRGTNLKYLFITLLLCLPIVYYLAKEPYRWRRILSFIDPWADPQGSGFQLIQSLIALGSGGLIGQGLGEGKQKLAFLPEIHTDFIFAHIGEEMGFVGAVAVVSLFLIISIRGLNIAMRQSDEFKSLLATGVTLLISFQALINFAVVTGLAPTKGLPLPFISYGGSSLLVNLMAVGVLLNLSRQKDSIFLRESEIDKPKRVYRYWRR
ncbi:MAG: putative lipid II flippase FtsW [Thermodesulfovibrionaceae bacterium]